MGVPLGFAPFANETRRTVAVVFLGGIAAFLFGYVGSAVVFFGFDALAHGADRTPIRIAGVFGSIACWGFYAIAFIRARGGPVLDAAVFPVVTATITPFAFRWLAFGPNWTGLRERFGFFLFRPDLLLDALTLLAPGTVFFATVMTVWASLLDEREIEEWKRTHLDAAFYEEFAEEE